VFVFPKAINFMFGGMLFKIGKREKNIKITHTENWMIISSSK